MEILKCVVEKVTYQNDENGYSVIKCASRNYPELITMTGKMAEIHVGSVLTVEGSWKINPKYGKQFAMTSYVETLPATLHGIEKYLGSGLIKGIGPKYAKKIVAMYGKDTIDVIENDPDSLNKIEGIGKHRIEMIKKGWEEQKEIKNIMLFLQSHDVSAVHAIKIYKTYGNDSLKVVQENPYKLADDIWGIGFKTADVIAKKIGFGHEKYVRLRSGLIYTLNKLSEEGHCYAVRGQLIKKGSELLEVADGLLDATLDEMIRIRDVIAENIPTEDPNLRNEKIKPEKVIYLPEFYYAETGVAKRLISIFNNGYGIKSNKTEMEISRIVEKKTGLKYDDIQIQAIMTAVTSKVMILTGGPGTGKTTTTLGIINAFQEEGAGILLAAPTGRAAKRLSETTNMEAKTIHRLLEASPPNGYKRNGNNPLEGDVIIIDECSMIDVMLMYNLLKAIPDNMTVILVGDVDQLPSVGAGNVLRDIIASECFPVVKLTKIFRQAQESRIITNAHKINSGEVPDISNGKETDFFFVDVEKMAIRDKMDVNNSEMIVREAERIIVDLVRNKLPKYYDIPSAEIQVLTPMQKGNVGTVNLNQKLQSAVNPGSDGIRKGGYLFRTKDKVMQIRNNYDKDVYNGDIGIIDYVSIEDLKLTVNYDGRLVEYEVSELDELVLAYATTIHKSQGSEYPIVIIPVLMNHFIMLQRNLIYTGITRAKKILILVGTKKALAYSIRNITVTKRNTMLKERILYKSEKIAY